jgi:hypothetical protein
MINSIENMAKVSTLQSFLSGDSQDYFECALDRFELFDEIVSRLKILKSDDADAFEIHKYIINLDSSREPNPKKLAADMEAHKNNLIDFFNKIITTTFGKIEGGPISTGINNVRAYIHDEAEHFESGDGSSEIDNKQISAAIRQTGYLLTLAKESLAASGKIIK